MSDTPKRTGRPRSDITSTSRVELRLTPDEHALWLDLAGDQPLGAWIRERCNTPRDRAEATAKAATDHEHLVELVIEATAALAKLANLANRIRRPKALAGARSTQTLIDVPF